MSFLDKFFGKKNTSAVDSNQRRYRSLEGWKVFSHSKYPERQVVIDYMLQYGIELVKSPNQIFYINHLNCDNFEQFQKMTNFRAKIGTVGHVAVEFSDGTVQNHFMTFEEAFNGLCVLYNEIMTTPEEDDY